MRDSYKKSKVNKTPLKEKERIFREHILPALNWKGTDMLWPIRSLGHLARIRGADLFKIIDWDMVYVPRPEEIIKVKMIDLPLDNGTTVITVATPEGWKCSREKCPFDYMHSHGTYASLEKKP